MTWILRLWNMLLSLIRIGDAYRHVPNRCDQPSRCCSRTWWSCCQPPPSCNSLRCYYFWGAAISVAGRSGPRPLSWRQVEHAKDTCHHSTFHKTLYNNSIYRRANLKYFLTKLHLSFNMDFSDVKAKKYKNKLEKYLSGKLKSFLPILFNHWILINAPMCATTHDFRSSMRLWPTHITANAKESVRINWRSLFMILTFYSSDRLTPDDFHNRNISYISKPDHTREFHLAKQQGLF